MQTSMLARVNPGGRSVKPVTGHEWADREPPAQPAGNGATSSNASAASSAAAVRSTTRSACCGPTSCSPTGTPADDSPDAHRRRRRPGHVEWIRQLHPVDSPASPLIRPEPPSDRGGGTPAIVGVTRSRTSWNRSTSRRLRSWHWSSARTRSSARRPGRPVDEQAQYRVDLLPGRGAAQIGVGAQVVDAREREPGSIGSSSNTVSTSTTSEPRSASTSTARRQRPRTSSSISAYPSVGDHGHPGGGSGLLERGRPRRLGRGQ